jgi:hypothetical protein
MTALVLWHLTPETVWASKDVRGFEDVAGYIVKDKAFISVLYDGYFNSNFVFSMRVNDPERKIFVFRASKTVFSTRMIPELGYRELVGKEEMFHDVLKQYSVKYIVQEKTDSLSTPANKKLRHWIQGKDFKLVKAFPMETEGYKNNGQLLIYEYLRHQSTPMDTIELDMPMLGRKITVKILNEETGKRGR